MFVNASLTPADYDRTKTGKGTTMADEIKAALYLRSAAHNDDAIEEQRRLCGEYAAARGWRIVATFLDNGASDVRADRPGLQALRQYVREERPTVVLVTEVARIARDLETLNDFLDFCVDHGMEIACVTGPAALLDRSRRRTSAQGGLPPTLRLTGGTR